MIKYSLSVFSAIYALVLLGLRLSIVQLPEEFDYIKSSLTFMIISHTIIAFVFLSIYRKIPNRKQKHALNRKFLSNLIDYNYKLPAVVFFSVNLLNKEEAKSFTKQILELYSGRLEFTRKGIFIYKYVGNA